MKKGETVQMRLRGAQYWVSGSVLLISENQRSLMLHGDDLPMPEGLTLHPVYGKVLTLLWEQEGIFREVITGVFYEIKEEKEADHLHTQGP